jgi:ABC-type glycerol-3-phosphate transport system permease component
MGLQATHPALARARPRESWLARHRAVIVRHAVINFFLLTILLPLLWVLLLSIKSLPDSMAGRLWPRNFDFTHYAYVFNKIDTLPVNLFNSIYVTAATVVITVFCAVFAGYALVHLKPRGGSRPSTSRPGWSRSSRSTASRTFSA